MSGRMWTPTGAKFDRPKKPAPKGSRAKANGHDHEPPAYEEKSLAGDERDEIDNHELPVIPWIDYRLSDFDDKELPDREWIVPDWIPREQVTGIYGPPGVNKTDFCIQLLMALSYGLPFMGYQLEARPCFGLFCEDTTIEIVRRAERIAGHYGMYLAEFTQFHFTSLVGFDRLEFVTFDGNTMTESRALKRFDMKIEETGAAFACLDTAPHFFGGNEVDRRQVSRFLRKLDAISIGRNCGVAITAHPSARGQRSGRMDSGSTGWEGGVRARIALTKPEQEPAVGDKQEPDRPPPDTKDRLLTLWKANYSVPGKTLDLVWDHGVFTTAALDAEKAMARGPYAKQACEAKFIELLRANTAQGFFVSDDPRAGRRRFAPIVFHNQQAGKMFNVGEYTKAMLRLIETAKLRLEFNASKRRHELVEDTTKGGQNATSTESQS